MKLDLVLTRWLVVMMVGGDESGCKGGVMKETEAEELGLMRCVCMLSITSP